MRFGPIIIVYFILGVVMWGGGVVAWNDVGVAQEFIEKDNSGLNPNEQTAGQLERTGGIVGEATQSLAGPVLLVWNLLTGFIAFLFWPVVTLQSVNAPPQLVVLSGVLCLAFFVAVASMLGRIS